MLPTLVLLHAFPLWSAMYDDVRPQLPSTCTLVTPDLAGFGPCPVVPGEPDLDVLADAAAAVLDRLGVERAIVGGTSMGGYTTMAFLRRHPDRVRGVVLADTRAAADSDAGRANRLRMAEEVLRTGTVDVVLEQVLPALLGETTKRSRAAVADRVRSWVERARPEAVAWAQRAMAARPGSEATLRDLAVPALVVVGEEDRLSPPEEAAAMAGMIPDARLVVLPSAGHLTPVESPAAFASAVSDFVAGLPD